MSNEKRIEEILYEAYENGVYEKLLELVNKREREIPYRPRVEHYEHALTQLYVNS